MEVFKNFLILKFKRDIIHTKIWFLSGKRWLANNMTGRVDTRLCKLESGWRLVKWMYQVLLSSLSSQRSNNNNNNNKIMPDLRLGWPQRWSLVRHILTEDPVMWFPVPYQFWRWTLQQLEWWFYPMIQTCLLQGYIWNTFDTWRLHL